MTTATVSKIVQQTVVVNRDGQRVVPPIGQPYKFTADEVKSISGQNADALRDPKNEDPDGVSAAAGAGQGGSSVEAGGTSDATKGKDTGGNSGDGKSEGEDGKQKTSAADGKSAKGGDKLAEGL